MIMNPPFERSYWVTPGRLAAGCYPGDPHPAEAERKLWGLVHAGIRHVINLMEEDETNRQGDPFIPYEEQLRQVSRAMHALVASIRLPIMDYNIPSHIEMRTILDEIDHSIDRGKPVFVHCWGGNGRTGTVVGCYLARHGIATGEKALGKIRELRKNLPGMRKPSPENDIQRDMVRSWKAGE